MKQKDDLIKLLNLNYLRLTNKTVSCGDMDMPAVTCNTEVFPDYIALYKEIGLYHKTDRTAVAFYEYDDDFDGKNGLLWAINYDVTERLDYFKKRFNRVKYIIVPDYSVLGDIHREENNHRLFIARIAALWFIHDIGSVVIPNITFPDASYSKIALDGYEESSVAAISTKGHMNDPAEIQRLRENIHLTVDRLSNLKTLIVYDVCSTNDKTLEIFSYAAEKGIEIIIPENTLKLRNMQLYGDRHDPQKAVVI